MREGEGGGGEKLMGVTVCQIDSHMRRGLMTECETNVGKEVKIVRGNNFHLLEFASCTSGSKWEPSPRPSSLACNQP